MKLKSYQPNSRDYIPDTIAITKAGSILFYDLVREKIGMKKESWAELIFDEDEFQNGGVKHIYIRLYEKKTPNTLKVSPRTQDSKTLAINAIGFLRQIKYSCDKQCYYKFVPKATIGSIDYVRINLDEPITEFEEQTAE